MERNRSSGELFERLWLLRACYPYRSDYDTRSTLTVGEVVLYGEQLMRLARLRGRWTGFGPIQRAA
ncbi:MAG: hypothetical protein ACRDHD_09555 [Candidatus Limnocylindria bacterium]